MDLTNSADRCNFATEGVNGQAEQLATRQPTPRCLDRRKVRRRASRFASCRLLTVPVLLASYRISSDRAWPTLCKRPGRLRPTWSVRSSSAPSDTATMPSKSSATRTAGDARAVPRARSPDVTAQIFWLKNRDPAHWRDAWQMEHVLGRYIISDRPMTEEG
jgi:hypothetical protein